MSITHTPDKEMICIAWHISFVTDWLHWLKGNICKIVFILSKRVGLRADRTLFIVALKQSLPSEPMFRTNQV